MKTVVIFTGCHLRDRKVISNCTQFEADQFTRMARHNGWRLPVRDLVKWFIYKYCQ